MTIQDRIRNAFGFLVTDLGFKLLTAEKTDKFRADNYLVYRNDTSNIQVEVCADESWFHSVIRRVINGIPADYNDTVNCLSFEDMAMWESENKYDHFVYYAGGKNGLAGVLENTAKLFNRNKEILTGGAWPDPDKIQSLKDMGEKGFSKINRPGFFSRLKEISKQELTDLGYKLTADSDLASPFENNSIIDKLIFEKEKSKIEITQKDWRDDASIYQVFKDGKKVFEIDISKTDPGRAAELTINAIKNL